MKNDLSNKGTIDRRGFLKCALLSGAAAASYGFGLPAVAAKDGVHGLKKAGNFKALAGGKVKCLLCPWGCEISPGNSGRCRVRKNVDGVLYSLVYGKPVAIHIDPVEKKPFYHFLPGRNALSLATVGCNLACSFCQNWEISQAQPGSLRSFKGEPEKITCTAASRKVPIIAYTYSEPIVFSEYMVDISKKAKEAGIRNVMISAGFINPGPMKSICRVLDGVKIDLKGFSDGFYKTMVHGRLGSVLRTLKVIKESGKWLEIVNLVIPGKNDNPKEIKKMCRWIMKNLGADVPLHFSRFIPMYKLKNVPPTPVKTLERCRSIALKSGLNYVYVGNVPGHPGNNTHCPKCDKVLIYRRGYRVELNGFEKGRCKSCGSAIAGVWR